MQQHLDRSGVMPPNQSGFKRGHGCTTALSKVIDDVLEATDKGKLTVLILLDYSKAFDTLNHELLRSKYKYIGLSEKASAILSDYLDNRMQAVSCGNRLSSFLSVTSGVPQGSILGPKLFSLYTADFPSVFISCSQHFYADDTQLYISFFPEESLQAVAAVNYELHNVIEFSNKHCLKLNYSKTTAIVFGSKTRRRCFLEDFSGHLTMSGHNVGFKDTVRNLGLYMDHELRFSEHVKKCLQQGYSMLKIIYQNRHLLSKCVKSALCDSLVLSRLNYCDVIYNFCITEKDSRRIQKLQNSCLRLIFGVRKYERISHTLKDIKWYNMSHRRFIHSACFFYSVLKLKSPSYLYNKIRYRTDVHNINIRFKGRLTIPAHRSQLYQRSFSYNIFQIANGFPCEVLMLPKLKFKKYVLNHLSLT